MASKKTRENIHSGAKILSSALPPFLSGLAGEITDRLLGGPDGGDLLVDPRRSLPAGTFAPSLLLRAEYQAVPFQSEGRQDLINDLHAWYATEDNAAVRLYTGAGGMGKTRLFIEFLGNMDGTGWHARFLSSQEPRISPQALDTLLEQHNKLFIIVDYAETRSAALQDLLKQASAVTGNNRVRVALIARNAAEWWSQLREGEADVQDLLMTAPEPIPVPALSATPETRSGTFPAAASAFAEKLKIPSPGITPPDLTQLVFDSALMILMSALAFLDGRRLEEADAILGYVLSHERRYWTKGARSQNLPTNLDAALAQAAVLATLAGGLADRDAARDLIRRAPLMGGQAESVVDTVADLLHGLYPESSDTWLHPVQPDVLGEHLVAGQANKDKSLLTAFFAAAPAFQSYNALTVLTRLAQRKNAAAPGQLKTILTAHTEVLAEPAINVAIQTGDPIGQILAKVLEVHNDPQLAARLVEMIPKDTVALREVAAVTTGQSLARLAASSHSGSPDDRAEKARLLNNQSVRLSGLGRREEALEAARESADIFRALSAEGPDAFRPGLALSLNNLSNRLSDLGRREEALETARESVDIRRALSAEGPDAFRPDLALSLNNLSNHLSGLGHREEALEAARESAGIFRALSAEGPDAFRPDLARSLNNLSIHLSGLGRREEALEAAWESVEIRRTLSAERPDAFRPVLAGSLNNLSNHLSNLGRREEALEVARESVDIYRALSAERPDAFRPELAISLGALSQCLQGAGRAEEALEAIVEAAGTLSGFFLAQPRAFAPSMELMVKDYLELAEELGREPDEGLIGPLVAKLEEMKGEDGEAGEGGAG
jgi:tetratricopeptide (TPR) repeat protein